VDSNVDGEGLHFEQGTGQMILGLDKALIGMGVAPLGAAEVSAQGGQARAIGREDVDLL
jgi:hypothetical protein